MKPLGLINQALHLQNTLKFINPLPSLLLYLCKLFRNKILLVVMDATLGHFFKPEKNLEFFRLKK